MVLCIDFQQNAGVRPQRTHSKRLLKGLLLLFVYSEFETWEKYQQEILERSNNKKLHWQLKKNQRTLVKGFVQH